MSPTRAVLGARRARVGLLRGVPTPLIVTTLAALLIASVVAGIGLGSEFIAPARVIDVLAARLSGTPLDHPHTFIVWNLRMPRTVLAVVVGAALALAGCAVQVLVRNPIADPYVLGLSSGAGVAAVASLTIFGIGALGMFTLPVAAFAGAALAGMLVIAVSANRQGIPALRLLLAGVAVAQLLAGVMSLMIVSANEPAATQQVVYWLLGSLAGSHWTLVIVSAVPTVVGAVLLGSRPRMLDLLSLGDEAAISAGVRPGSSRILTFVLASLLTGAAVATSGTIGFIGLVVPHVARMLVGARHARVLPVSALLGSLLLVIADIAARTLGPTELPVGIFTAFLGVPLFVMLVRRAR